MRRTAIAILASLLTCLAAVAQTLNVQIGQVIYQIPSAQAGEMVYQNGTTVTIMDKAYTLSEVTQMYFDNSIVDNNTVSVVYEDTSAKVYVSGDIARYVSATVNGAHVSIAQSAEVDNEITYTLTGSSTNGSFYMSGSYKATLALNGITLTNPTGSAINIQNGKRIDVSVKKDTQNTLTDCANGTQKACLVIKGHAEFKGYGVLNVNGLTAHGIKTGEYMSVKNCTINVLKAVKDGIHANEYFLMTSGTVDVKGVGDDAIQAEIDGTTNTGETTDHENEDSGNIYIEGGTLTLTTTANGTKCLKSDSTIIVSGGELTLKASGGIDQTDATDLGYVAGIKAGKFVQNGGSIGMTITGTAGRGVAAYDLVTNGGELNITNSAAPQTISSDVKSAKGLKGLNIALNAGTIKITMSGNASKAIKAGDGTKTSGSRMASPMFDDEFDGFDEMGDFGVMMAPPGPGGGGGGSSYTNVKGSYTQGLADGTGPTLTVSNTGSAFNSSSAKAIKAICAVTLYGGTTEVTTKTSGGEGLESKTSVDIKGGKHYFACYDDCINSAGKIFFNGGVTVCYSNGNDAVDSNAGTTGAITIGNGAVFAYTTKGAPEEGLDCDNNSYIQITGTGIAISAGANQGGGGGGWGGSSSGNTISNAKQGYAFVTSTISYASGRYYTLSDASGNNLVTYSFPASCSSSLALFTATGMVKNSTYNVKYSTTAPTDATTAWHGFYIGSSAKGTTSVTSFTAK